MWALALKLLPSWWSRAAVVAAALAAFGAWAWYQGMSHERGKWEARQAQDEAGYLAAVVRAAKLEDRVVYQYIDRWRTVVERGDTIVKEVPVYVTRAADARCVVPRGFVRVHDAAAENVLLSGPAGAADEAPAGLALSAVAGTVAGNYREFHAMKTQCEALQAWARSIQAVPRD